MPEIEQMGESDLDIVTVTPFVHQVGGHTCVLQVTPNVVCKPYQENEVMFYRKLPEGLQGFVPFYRGMKLSSVLSIKCVKLNASEFKYLLPVFLQICLFYMHVKNTQPMILNEICFALKTNRQPIFTIPLAIIYE